MNVGIGTSSPLSKLAVSGGASIGADYNIAAPTNGLIVEGNVGIGTTTPGSLLSLNNIANFTTATSSFYSTGGFNLAGGCFAINGTCVGGGSGAVSSVSNADGTLTVSPTTGAVVASLNLGNANAWTARQNFANASTTLLSVFNKAYFGGTATTTIDSAGNIAVAGTANVTGKTTLANASTTDLSASGSLYTPITSALLLADSNKLTTAYAGSTCTNQFVRSLNGAGVATCASVSLTADVSGILPIANGGTNNSSAYTAGSVIFSNGTSLTQNNANFFWDNTNKRLGVGSSTPWAKLAVHANNGETNTMLFQIASSTATATTSLFSVDNTGLTTVGDSSGTGDANFQFAADANAWSVGYNSTDKSFNIASSTNFSANVAFTILKNNLNVGIGTTTPWRGFSVAGTVAFSSNITSSATGDVLCLAANGEVTRDTTPGAGVCGNSASDERIKTDVVPITGALNLIKEIQPVSFAWKNPSEHGGNSTSTGFVAQQLETVFPQLVSEDTCRGADCMLLPDGKMKTISVGGPEFQAFLTGSIKELAFQVDPITSATSSPSEITSGTASSTVPWIASFSDASQSLKDGINGLADTLVHVFKNVVYAWTGIFNKVFAREVHTDKLCVSDNTGETCITKAQLDALLAGAAAPGSGGGQTSTTITSIGGDTSTGGVTSGTPLISINGNNPATINVGDAYADLGAVITGPAEDVNLGIHASVDGATSTPIADIVIDTSSPGTHTIVYSATDQNGLTGTATRTVHVVALSSGASTEATSLTDSTSLINSEQTSMSAGTTTSTTP